MTHLILLSPQAFNELLRNVSGKWETISLLIILLFFLASAAFFYAVLQAMFRPSSLIHHSIILLFCLLGGWQTSTLAVKYGLSGELHRYACLDLMERHLHSRASATMYCEKKNPIRLKHAGAPN